MNFWRVWRVCYPFYLSTSFTSVQCIQLVKSGGIKRRLFLPASIFSNLSAAYTISPMALPEESRSWSFYNL